MPRIHPTWREALRSNKTFPRWIRAGKDGSGPFAPACALACLAQGLPGTVAPAPLRQTWRLQGMAFWNDSGRGMEGTTQHSRCAFYRLSQLTFKFPLWGVTDSFYSQETGTRRGGLFKVTIIANFQYSLTMCKAEVLAPAWPADRCTRGGRSVRPLPATLCTKTGGPGDVSWGLPHDSLLDASRSCSLSPILFSLSPINLSPWL